MPQGTVAGTQRGALCRMLLAVLLSWVIICPAWGASSTCLRCHPRHYAGHGSCSDCHRGDERAIRPALAHHDLIPGSLAGHGLPGSAAVARGQRLAGLLACRRCHLLAQSGNRLASDLDRVVQDMTLVRLRRALQEPAWYMPDFRLGAAERDDLLTYLLSAAKGYKRAAAARETPQVVHFADDGRRREDPFSRHCGGCHQTLTPRWGGLGRGRVAPNLAGLLGAHYPPTFTGRLKWNPQRLRNWLNNPRESRTLATMPPIVLSSAEFSSLVRVIDVDVAEDFPK